MVIRLIFLLTQKRDKKAALSFFNKEIDHNGKPSLINLDKSRVHKAGIERLTRIHTGF